MVWNLIQNHTCVVYYKILSSLLALNLEETWKHKINYTHGIFFFLIKNLEFLLEH